ncbi:hypothetical protein BV898_00139 [Hypsibius exemplaris]|uniref:Cadherin domain-containing protein n=1 Tax=Hypsibius exemplaris TaxID=2072580 RepID=A0A1W0XEV0_HYPEX|nr:hypothetical protein BV898_00139 [Hypsibius exemplaris]
MRTLTEDVLRMLFVLIIIASECRGRLWSRVTDQDAISRIVQKTKALQLDPTERQNSVWDNYDHLSQKLPASTAPAPVLPNGDLLHDSLQEKAVTPYFGIFKAKENVPNLSTSPSPPVVVVKPNVPLELPTVQLMSDQPVFTNSALPPDSRAIQNVIRETVPKTQRNQNRWAFPMFSQSLDATMADTKPVNWRPLEPVVGGGNNQVQSPAEEPWQRVLAAPLTGKPPARRNSTSSPNKAGLELGKRQTVPSSFFGVTTARPSVGKRVLQSKPQHKETQTNERVFFPEQQAANAEAGGQSIILHANTANFFPTLRPKPSFILETDLISRDFIQPQMQAVLANPLVFASSPDQWSSQLQSVQPLLPTFQTQVGPVQPPANGQKQLTQSHFQIGNFAQSQAGQDVLINPLGFASTADQWGRESSSPFRPPTNGQKQLNLPPPLSTEGLNYPKNFQAVKSPIKTQNFPPPPDIVEQALNHLTYPQDSATQPTRVLINQNIIRHPLVPVAQLKKQSARYIGYQRRTPPPFYGHRRLHHRPVGFNRLENPVTFTPNPAHSSNIISEEELNSLITGLPSPSTTQQRPARENHVFPDDPRPTSSSSSFPNVLIDNPTSRQTTPFVCPCLTTVTGNDATPISVFNEQPMWKTQSAKRDLGEPGLINQFSSGGDVNALAALNTIDTIGTGHLSYPSPQQLNQQSNPSFSVNGQGQVPAWFNPPQTAGSTSTSMIGQFALGPSINSESGNQQLVMQVPLTDTLGQPLETTTPSQWQPFIPRWSTTELTDSGGQNKQLQLQDHGPGFNPQGIPYAVQGGGDYAGGQQQQQILLPDAPDPPSYTTDQQAFTTVPMDTINGGRLQYSRDTGSKNGRVTKVCPDAPVGTQPPITVDIIRTVKRITLSPVIPICKRAIINVKLDAATLPGTVIGTLLAEDPTNNTLLWSIERDMTGLFRVDKFTGDFALTGSLNDINNAEVVVRATNPAGQFCQTLIDVVVNRMDRRALGLGPQFANWFSQDVYNVTIPCSLPNGTLVMQATAKAPSGDVERYRLDGTTEFRVNNTGYISITGLNITQQAGSMRSFKLFALDNHGNQASSWINVFLDVSTCYGPQFDMAAYIYDVQTDCAGVRPTDQIAQIQALPPSPGSVLSYNLIGTSSFMVDSMSGIISSAGLLESSQRLPDFGIVVSDTFGRMDTATVRISITVNCTQQRKSILMSSDQGVQPAKQQLLEDHSQTKLGDFLLRVACNASKNTLIGTLNPTKLMSLEKAVPDLRLEQTTSFAILPNGEIRTLTVMPTANATAHFEVVGDGSSFGMGRIVGNVTVQVQCG